MTCSRTQHCAASGERIQDLSIWSLILYHYLTVLQKLNIHQLGVSDGIFQASFFCALLLFSLYHGVRQVGQQKSCNIADDQVVSSKLKNKIKTKNKPKSFCRCNITSIVPQCHAAILAMLG